MIKTKIGICDFSNDGRLREGIVKVLSNPANRDMELVAIFCRTSQVIPTMSNVEVISIDIENYIYKMDEYRDEIELMILCDDDSKNLLKYGPQIAECFNTVDCFNNREKLMQYLKKMDDATYWSGTTSIIAVGLDFAPFSTARGCAETILSGSIGTCDAEYTGSFLIAYARAAVRLAEYCETGIKTILDVPPVLLAYEDSEKLIERLLNE